MKLYYFSTWQLCSTTTTSIIIASWRADLQNMSSILSKAIQEATSPFLNATFYSEPLSHWSLLQYFNFSSFLQQSGKQLHPCTRTKALHRFCWLNSEVIIQPHPLSFTGSPISLRIRPMRDSLRSSMSIVLPRITRHCPLSSTPNYLDHYPLDRLSRFSLRCVSSSSKASHHHRRLSVFATSPGS